jgi:hypothetical protein
MTPLVTKRRVSEVYDSKDICSTLDRIETKLKAILEED